MGRGAKAAAAMLMLLAGVLTSAQWGGHVDDSDANLYRVVVRHMVEDGSWTALRYLPAVHPEFREHLPFGFWPMAGVARIAGESSLPVFAALCTLATIALTGWIGRRIFGSLGGLVAMGVLATTESFVVLGGRGRLDPLLVLLATASAAPLLVGRPRARQVLMAGLFAGLAALVKGPFGIIPLCAAWLARFLLGEEGRTRVALRAIASVLLAATPLVAFLAWDHVAGGNSWWQGYGLHQLLASAVGDRVDGQLAWWFPFQTLAGRFWPGLPFAVLGLVLAARRDREHPLRLVAICTLAAVLVLCLPSRKIWNHALVVYPLLALLGGGAVAPYLRRWIDGAPSRKRTALATLGALTLGVVILSVSGAGRRILPSPCLGEDLAAFASQLREGDSIALVSDRADWGLIAALAAERRLEPWPVHALADLPSEVSARTRWLLLPAGSPKPSGEWVLVGRDARRSAYRRP